MLAGACVLFSACGPMEEPPMVAARRTLYFTADDGVHGREPWASEGAEGSQPSGLTPLGGKVIFTTR